MKTVSCFEHKGRKVHIFKHASLKAHDTFYGVSVDGEALPGVSWPNAGELERAIRTFLEQEKQ